MLDDADQGASMAAEAARLLVTPTALHGLELEDARRIVAYMAPRHIALGTTFVREGETHDNDHMLLVLEGDVTIESSVPSADDHLMVRFLGPGSLIGELGLLDGEPRSVSCIAASDLLVATLSRADLGRLLEDDPRLGARFLLAITKRMADTLRETTRKLKLFAQMNKTLSDELVQVAKDPGWFDR